MYKIISEIESLGDSGESFSRILARRNAHGKSFDDATVTKIDTLISLVDNAYEVMIANLKNGFDNKIPLDAAYSAEKSVNNMRDTLREEEISSIEYGGTHYQTSVYYMDLVTELEKMGDYIINVSEALA